jgi:pantoate--beta-alanine ligase
MGFLHEGHLSLVRRARDENDNVIVSIFVNPAQFAPEEDLDSYPRDLDRDIRLLKDEDVDLRPTHFQGVSVVVAKLFNIIKPTRAYFGQKDAQQGVVVKRMVKDLDFDLDIVLCPIVREADGLAMSSRNVRLSPEDRQVATILYRSLLATADKVSAGERDAEVLRKYLHQSISSEPRARIDYVSVTDPETLLELSSIGAGVLISTAVFFGKVRLIDNILVTDSSG